MKRKIDFVLKSHNGSIVFEDDQIIVIDKPAHLLVIPDRYNHSLPSLDRILKEELGNVLVVHRIDRETSGVVVFAKTPEAHSALNSQFEARDVRKTYLAIVLGEPKENEGVIETPIAESQKHPGIMKVDIKHGKASKTNYKVVERFDGFALVEVMPGTGRMHQIRIHLSSIGLPIMCDHVYGNGRPFFLSEVKPRYYSEGDEKPLLTRTGLHAESISFIHPSSKEPISFKAEMPKDMRSVINYLRKFRSPKDAFFGMGLKTGSIAV